MTFWSSVLVGEDLRPDSELVTVLNQTYQTICSARKDKLTVRMTVSLQTRSPLIKVPVFEMSS